MAITKDSAPTPSPTASGGGLTPEQQQALNSILAAGGGASATGPGRVFMGLKAAPGNSRFLTESAQAQLQKRTTPSWMATDDALGTYFTWSQKQRDDFRAKGLLSGLLTQGAGDLEGYQLWQNLVNQAALYGAKNQQVGPMDILSGYVKANSSGGWIKQGNFEINPVTGEKRYIGPQYKTTTQNSVNLTDPATARAVATQVFQQLLGRDPNSGEIQAYAQALAQSESQNPSSTTTTTQYDMTTGDPIGSNSVTTGGMTDNGRALLAEDEAKRNPEYGATQAATTYMSALESAIGGSR